MEAVMALALVSVMLASMFAMNLHLLAILKQGKENTYATQMAQERVEQFRTALWDEVTDATKLRTLMRPATATAANLPDATETLQIEPLVNPTNVRVRCIRNPIGEPVASGDPLTAEDSVKVRISVRWDSRRGPQSRSFVTILTNGGI
jgi:multidrug efflux pump subunit AcrA (membrane-fusion protein)